MNKIKWLSIGLVFGIMISFTSTSFASDFVKAVYSDFIFYVNGVKAEGAPKSITIDNRTYLNVRDVAELLNYQVSYDGSNRSISFNSSTPTTNTQSEQITTSSNETTNDLGRQSSIKIPEAQKLPITVSKLGYSLTVNHIEKLDWEKIRDPKFLVNITVKITDPEEAERVKAFYLVEISGGYVNVGHDDVRAMGNALLAEKDWVWRKPFREDEFTVDIPYSDIIDETVKNIDLYFTPSPLPISNSESLFRFTIDTTDMW